VASAECTPITTSGLDHDALADARSPLFYQLLAACGEGGANEGPL